MSVEAVPTAHAKVLMALARLDRPTVRAVAAEAGMSIQPTHQALRELRDEGMVAWTDGRQGTMRATFECRWPS